MSVTVCVFVSPTQMKAWITTRVAYTKLKNQQAMNRAHMRRFTHPERDHYLNEILEDKKAYAVIEEHYDVISCIQKLENAGLSVIGCPRIEKI